MFPRIKLCERYLAFLFLRRYSLSANCLNWIEVEVPRIRGTFLVIGSFVRRGKGGLHTWLPYTWRRRRRRRDGWSGWNRDEKLENRYWSLAGVLRSLPRVLRGRTWAFADTVMTCVYAGVSHVTSNDIVTPELSDRSNSLTSELILAKCLIDSWTRQPLLLWLNKIKFYPQINFSEVTQFASRTGCNLLPCFPTIDVERQFFVTSKYLELYESNLNRQKSKL